MATNWRQARDVQRAVWDAQTAQGGCDGRSLCQGHGQVLVTLADTAHPAYGTVVACVCCRTTCEARWIAEVGIPARHAACSLAWLDGLTTRAAEGKRRAWKAAEAFIAGEYPTPWMVLQGRPGTGKTALAAAIVSERARAGQPARWLDYQAFQRQVLEAQRRGFHEDGETMESIIQAAIDAPLLVLDDLGDPDNPDAVTAFQRGNLFLVLDGRIKAVRETIITTNLDNAGIERTFGERLADRILNDMTTCETLGGPSLRSSRGAAAGTKRVTRPTEEPQ